MPFIKILESFAPISDDCKAALYIAITSKSYKKGQTILLPGDINTKLYFIETGLAKVYYDADADADADARQIISWFGYEGGFLCSVRSYLSQIPSREYIEILEDSKLLAIEYDDLQRLLE
jgi:CRP-like cAMP-binding protein